jgi:hypothetical protein
MVQLEMGFLHRPGESGTEGDKNVTVCFQKKKNQLTGRLFSEILKKLNQLFYHGYPAFTILYRQN